MTEEVQETTTEVTQAEQNTAPESSTEEQTVQDQQVEESASTAEESQEDIEDNKIPYKRFKGINDQLSEAKSKLAEYEAQKAEAAKPQMNDQDKQIAETLKRMGFITKEEQQRTLQQRDEDAQLQNTLSGLEKKYSGVDGTPKFKRSSIVDYCLKNGISNPEMGYKIMNEKAIIDAKVKAAMGTNVSVKSEASDGSGKSMAKTTNQDLRDSIIGNPNTPEGKAALSSFLLNLTKGK